jgi:uncharacterized protein YbjT (DUF2867 family)
MGSLGATGHIGGTILNAVMARYPAVHVIALVRDTRKGELLRQRFHGLQTRLGSLLEVSLIETESAAAQVVISLS